MPLAEPWQSRLSTFQRLLVLRCLRPDKGVAGMQMFVAAQMGPRFLEPPPLELSTVFKEAGPTSPLVFVLSAGAWAHEGQAARLWSVIIRAWPLARGQDNHAWRATGRRRCWQAMYAILRMH